LSHQTTQGFPEKNPGTSAEICILINSVFYLVDSVFIIRKKGYYCLVVRHKGKLLMDKTFKTLRGAKIAFSKLFKHRNWRENVKAEWSLLFEPDIHWLEENKIT